MRLVVLRHHLLQQWRFVFYKEIASDSHRIHHFESLAQLKIISLEATTFAKRYIDKNNTFGLFLKGILQILQTALRLAQRMHTMNVIPMQILIKHQNREIHH